MSARRLRVYRRRPAAYPRHIGCMADAMYRRHHLVTPRDALASPMHREVSTIHPGVSHTLWMSGIELANVKVRS